MRTAKTFKEIYESIDPTAPKTAFIRRVAKATMKSEQTVKMWLYGRQDNGRGARQGVPSERT